MGIFKDFATSGYGDFTVGALSGLAERGQQDAERNAVFAQDSLNKENEAFKQTELAFNNKKQITNIIANNPLAFGITATADLNANQIADRLTNRIFNEQRSIFESNDFNKVKSGVAKYLTRPDTLGTGIELTSPYVPSEDLFSAEQEKHSAKLSEISKMPKVDKLLMNIKQAEEDIATPEAITDSLTKVASITAKGYGILNTFPGTTEGNTNLKFMQTNIIVANAKAQFPNDATARANFIDKKLYDNNIDPMSAVNFQNPVTFQTMSKVLDVQGSALASKIAENTNAMAQATTDEERVQIQNQINSIIMQQYQLINTFSGSAPFALAGKDASKVGTMKEPEIKTQPDEPEKKEQPDVMKEIEEEASEPIDSESISPFQAKFNFNVIDKKYLVDQWSKKYQGKNTLINRARATTDLFLGSNDMPEEAVQQIDQVANAFDGDNGFNKNQISEILSAIGFIESDGYKYKKQGLNKIDDGLGVARSYWQVEPSTAESILDENLNAMKAGKAQLLGPKFEQLFKNKYKNVIGNRTALEYFASLNQSQLQDLLLKDGLFAAMMAGHKVVSTFDPYGSREA